MFDAVDDFLAAIGSEDKTDLADHMIPEGVIFVHNHMDPENPRVDIVPVSQHLARWATLEGVFEEKMGDRQVMKSYGMAHVWGGYSFSANGSLRHCGVNSLSLVLMDDGSWKVGNASFTMVPPDQCRFVGANWVPGASWPAGSEEE